MEINHKIHGFGFASGGDIWKKQQPAKPRRKFLEIENGLIPCFDTAIIIYTSRAFIIIPCHLLSPNFWWVYAWSKLKKEFWSQCHILLFWIQWNFGNGVLQKQRDDLQPSLSIFQFLLPCKHQRIIFRYQAGQGCKFTRCFLSAIADMKD